MTDVEEKKDLFESTDHLADYSKYKHVLYDKLGHSDVIAADATLKDVEYLYDKAIEMPIDEALQIMSRVLKDHDDDPNFPYEDYELIKKLIKGHEESGFSFKDWEFQAKMYATLNEYHSPYPEVRAISSPLDDPSIPCETIRAYFLGFVWCIVGTGVNEIFSRRQPSLYISSSVCQMLMYPSGLALQTILPDWGFTLFGTRHSLNPGPWTYKEQMFATVMFDIAIGGMYVGSNFYVEKLDIFYGNKWITIGYQILISLATQLFGFGFAGLLRKIVIYPIRAVWPTVLPTLALNQALLKREKKESIHGWTITRYKFFLIVFSCSFLYMWVPDYLFQALSYFNWMTWIKPDNFNLAVVTGSIAGLGLNPIASWDWNIIGYWLPLAFPFYTYLNMMIGMFIGFFVIIGLYYSNYKWTAYMPINDNNIYANTGEVYNVSSVLTNGKLDEAKYELYGPPYLSAGMLVNWGANCALYAFLIPYVLYSERKGLLKSLRSIWNDITSLKHVSLNDPHSRLMSKYKEVPQWMFVVVMLMALVFAIVCVEVYPANTPVWGIFLVLAINVVFVMPLCVIYAVTGYYFTLQVFVELIVGYAIPGNGDALMFLQALGYNITGQAQQYIYDQKIAHYAKVPPRAVFRGQFIGTIFQIIISLVVINWEINHVEGICTDDQPNNFSCPSETSYYSSSVFWGVIGPKRVFNKLYPVLPWCFLIGFGIALICLVIRKYYHRQTQWFQPAVIIGGFLNYAPYNLSYFLPGLYVCYAFNHVVKKRYQAWWEKYNYILASALDAGVAFGGIIIFFAVQYHEKDINWWGNLVSYSGTDGGLGQTSLKDPTTAPDGYFGIRMDGS
ncbi:hypothetical protein OGAPHI_004517 [Ogataea philodendri]|uniref:Oligopeptide transporter n=1 Tax=Ogataea philodendri TaxID=1378263 RepID=A0A9P8P6B8_9ASCO|nr:uncharacterized protein OGAPHI_004517 [Ogataea philodendri]KAH3666328.1 hypothetical protein OGAPHI_004517 [Ogataea philodendri]